MQTVYIGMDVHKKFTMAVAMNQRGKILGRERIPHGASLGKVDWKEYLAKYSNGAKPHVILEATSISSPIFEAVEPHAKSVSMAHPLKTKLIAEEKVKTDAIDGETIAHLKRTNFLPTAYIPPREIRDQREFLRHRISLVHTQTSMKNRIHALLSRCGEFYPGTDLFGGGGRNYLKALSIREPYRQELERYLRLLDFIAGEIKQLTRLIHQKVEVSKEAARLTQIPGIGKYLAALIYWETGEITRFISPAKYVSYCRLIPSVHSTGGKTFYGPIAKQGNKYLGWALICAAQKYAIRRGPLGDFFRRIEKKHGSKVARVATARKLAIIIWHMLTKNEDFDEGKILADRNRKFPGLDGAAAMKHGR